MGGGGGGGWEGGRGVEGVGWRGEGDVRALISGLIICGLQGL